MKTVIRDLIPTHGIKIEQKETKDLVYLYTTTAGTYIMLRYQGRKRKPTSHYRYKTKKQRLISLKKILNQRLELHKKDLAIKAERKEELKKLFDSVEVGNIFKCSWGYDQTNVDFYQLIDLKGATGTFREIASKSVKDTQGFECERVKADPNKFIGEPFKKRLTGASIKITSYSHANKIKDPINTSFYSSWYA